MPHTGTTPQTVLFPDLFTTPVVATFDQQHASSDGGAVLLKAAEMQYGVIEGFARCLLDDRQPGTVRHALGDLLGQRIFGIACGHPDANDADRRADDPIHKLVLGRDPVDGAPLATQPTISRFENHVGVQELYAMGCELAASVIERHQRRRHGRARRITIDLDANAVLTRYAEAAMGEARTQSEASGHTEHVYTDARYAARTGGRKRRVIIKAEVVRLDGREPRRRPPTSTLGGTSPSRLAPVLANSEVSRHTGARPPAS